MAVVQMDYYSQCHRRNVHLEMIAPGYDGWNQTKEPYRTLYLITEQGMGANEAVSLLSLRLWSMLKGIAVVVISYDDCFGDKEEQRIGEKEVHICEEILEVSRNIFPLSREKSAAFIGGIGVGAKKVYELAAMIPSAFSKTVSFASSEDKGTCRELASWESQLQHVFSLLNDEVIDSDEK